MSTAMPTLNIIAEVLYENYYYIYTVQVFLNSRLRCRSCKNSRTDKDHSKPAGHCLNSF